MPLVGPTPIFRGVAVFVIFDPAIPLADARMVHAVVTALVHRLTDQGATADDLAAAILRLIAECGFPASEIGRTREAMEYSVGRAAAPPRSIASW